MWEKIIEVNLLGTYRTVRAALPHLSQSRGYVAARRLAWRRSRTRR